MALKGTIRDFGIADIFQLIGQQTKSGILLLKDEVDEVKIHFREGSVVRAESSTRPKQMLLGNMLLNAGVITKSELDQALQQQTRTMRRIGLILADDVVALSRTELAEFLRLQLNETVFRLFLWHSGTYEFEQHDVAEAEDGLEAIRAENILMDGLRVMDEWPSLRERLPPFSTVFEVARDLPEPKAAEAEFSEFDLGGDMGGEDSEPSIGDPERRIYGFVRHGLKLEKLIHLSRLGEFEACRAVMVLVDGGFIRPAVSVSASRDLPATADVAPRARIQIPFGPMLTRALTYVIIMFGVGLVVRGLRSTQLDGSHRLEVSAPRAVAARNQVERLELALEVFRLEHGGYPERLSELVTSKILGPDELRFPFERPYDYTRDGLEVRIEPPLY
jgi:hypothetical protein